MRHRYLDLVVPPLSLKRIVRSVVVVMLMVVVAAHLCPVSAAAGAGRTHQPGGAPDHHGSDLSNCHTVALPVGGVAPVVTPAVAWAAVMPTLPMLGAARISASVSDQTPPLRLALFLLHASFLL